MSAIALIINDLGSQSAKCTSLLASSFALSMGAIRNAVGSGSPVIEKKLFDRKDPSFPQRLLDVLEKLDGMGCKWTAVELLEGQIYSPANKYYEISPDRLRNMITAREESLEQQRRLGQLQDGAQ